ncbi:polyamine aminopropyltransferase [Symbiobacterium thermophilum]|uniref:Polyamine aminopropyltransferase n=1 Tax=Symbiobacterium thermophilum TaxID=2734 RepID=A0A953IDS6_SYMTR|nr:polyamine aminopropyltransferase [Symbiobacterium thermophilum]MBY6276490.1 spermidine synthase [Symbiobacterium thermophilum]
MNRGDWLIEEQTPSYQTRWRVREVLHEEQTPYQKLQVLELEDFGRALVLDDAVQTTVGDEFIYHEMIAHVPLFTHPHPERVLIIGGGDGGTAREVCRHESVQKVDMVEIDRAVIEACRKHLPEIACGMDHPKVNLVVADGIAWVADHADEYDVIIVDSSDPVGPAKGLFNQAFYKNVFRALKADGLFVCQVLSPFFHQSLIRDVYGVVSAIFPITMPYLAVVPTYPSGLHCFMLGSKRHSPLREGVRTPAWPTRWYTPAVHRAAFQLPPVVAQLLEPSGSQAGQ